MPTRTALGATTGNRKWFVDVSPDGTTWTALMGMTNFQPTWDDASLQDDSDFDGGGAKSQTKTAFGWSAQATVRRGVQSATPTTYDPGQEMCRTTAIGKTGLQNSMYIRAYEMEPSGPRVEAYSGRCAVSWAEQGGAMDDLSTVQITFTGQGALSQITHPAP